jgi:glycosyltransferase involved in cell wall biosynthesis
MKVTQIDLQPYFGGGEVYAAFLCRALSLLGVSSRLIVHTRARYWKTIPLPEDTELVPVKNVEAAAGALPARTAWLLGHGPLPPRIVTEAHAKGALVTAIAHMPIQGRNPLAFSSHDLIFAVSGWVRDGLVNAGLPVWNEPLYGIADLSRTSVDETIRRTSRYDWDRRKFRDRVLSWVEPVVESLRPHPYFRKRPGLTLGIVSRLTPIKQFPRLFELLAPVISRHPGVNVEIFGSGGFASVRDLTRALVPIADRVRFWGHQQNVAAVYRAIDYLMTGLPEKEALGLNVIEAQACGTPVLAPAAPPFTETVLHGVTGFLYPDPRGDGGKGFDELLATLTTLLHRPRPQLAPEHIEKFSFEAFVERIRPIVSWAESNCRP